MAEDKPKHTKITKYEVQGDGTIKAITESYFDNLASRKEDVIQNVKTDHNTFLSDVIACLDVITKHQTRHLQLNISVDEWHKPSLIVKQYTIRKEDFKRR